MSDFSASVHGRCSDAESKLASMQPSWENISRDDSISGHYDHARNATVTDTKAFVGRRLDDGRLPLGRVGDFCFRPSCFDIL